MSRDSRHLELVVGASTPARGRGFLWSSCSNLSVAALVCCLFVAVGRAADRSDEPLQLEPRGEFAVGKNGRLILLPVRFGDRTISCLLDTGASLTGFDQSLRDKLGAPWGTRLLKTPAGLKRVETCHWPEVTLGGQPLEAAGPVACLDLADARRATNEDILGVIGMDILGTRRLQIDFDRGNLSLLETLPPATELGKKIPMEISRDGTPFITGSAGNDRAEQFLIDTGAQGNSLDTGLFDQLMSHGAIRLGKSSVSATVAGEVRGDRGVVSGFSVGPFAHDTLRFSRANVNSLGIRYLSRFRVTFDFPGKAVYLRKGAHYTKAEPSATSGLMLNWIDGEAVVEAVRDQGPADIVGIRPRDVLVSVDGNGAIVHDPFLLRLLLTSEGGRKVAVAVHRDGRVLKFEIVLAGD